MRIDWRSFTKKFVREEDQFPFGVRFYDAIFGGGKSLSMVHDALELKAQFPDMVLISNLIINDFDLQFNFTEVQQLIDYIDMFSEKNHVLIIIDEALTYFAENGGIDPALLSSITQSRKNRVMIYIATQKFKRVNNRLRDFSSETVKCSSFWFIQCNTVRDDSRLMWDKDEMDFVGPKKYIYIFKRNKDLFSRYDTLAKISLNKNKNLSTSTLYTPVSPPTPPAAAGVYEVKIKRRK